MLGGDHEKDLSNFVNFWDGVDVVRSYLKEA
jgi:hypothetical protein